MLQTLKLWFHLLSKATLVALACSTCIGESRGQAAFDCSRDLALFRLIPIEQIRNDLEFSPTARRGRYALAVTDGDKRYLAGGVLFVLPHSLESVSEKIRQTVPAYFEGQSVTWKEFFAVDYGPVARPPKIAMNLPPPMKSAAPVRFLRADLNRYNVVSETQYSTFTIWLYPLFSGAIDRATVIRIQRDDHKKMFYWGHGGPYYGPRDWSVLGEREIKFLLDPALGDSYSRYFWEIGTGDVSFGGVCATAIASRAAEWVACLERSGVATCGQKSEFARALRFDPLPK